MRARDVRAIAFCALSAFGLFIAALLILDSYLIAVAVTGAWLAFALTRPRMLRVIRRMRGEPDWGGYFRND
jgi:hypothetical protein